MTHHTDAERAEFEAWALRQPWIKDCQRYPGLPYGHYETQKAWITWQAARSAPAAPVPQGYKITEEQHVAAVKVLHRAAGVDGLPQRMLDAMLAAAPQPPEAAPVQLPEPAIPGSQGVCCGNFTTGGYYMGQHEQVCCGCPDDAHPPYYTEQQVRELLAAHGIMERST